MEEGRGQVVPVRDDRRIHIIQHCPFFEDAQTICIMFACIGKTFIGNDCGSVLWIAVLYSFLEKMELHGTTQLKKGRI